MARRTLTWSVLLSLAPSLWGQQVLDPRGVVDRPAGDWADTVLVAFDTRPPLGSVRRVGMDRVMHCVLKDPAATVFRRMLGPGLMTDPQAEALVLKVNKLRVDEVGSASICHLHAEVLGRSHGAYTRLFEAPVLIQGDRATRDGSVHETNIVAALQEFLTLFAQRARDTAPAAVPVAHAALHVPMVVSATEAPILAIPRPKRGLYRDYLQMRMDRPDTLVDFELRESMASLGGRHLLKMKRVRDTDTDALWGLSDGVYPYMRVGNAFVRLDRTLHGYEALVPRSDTQDPGAILLGGLYFGLVGATIAAVATTTAQPPLRCELDLLCGELMPPGGVEAGYGSTVFQVSRFAKSGAPVHIAAPGGTAIDLAKGEWTSLRLPPQAGPVPITISTAGKSEMIELDTNTDLTHVYSINLKKDGRLVVARLGEQMRNAALDDLRTEDRRP